MAAPTQRKPNPGAVALQDEDARLRQARRERRLRRSAGIVLIVIAFIAVAIAISAGRGGGPPKPGSTQAKRDAAAVAKLLQGIPQSGTTLGSPRAPVTVTEFADLECSVCRSFALGAEKELIAHEVRPGRVKLVYRSLCTATCTGPLGHSGFIEQQSAAYAAGLQGLGWYYIALFYEEQGAEGTSYVTPRYLDALARQIPRLEYRKWQSDSRRERLRAQLDADGSAAAAQGFAATPTIVVKGPRGRAQPIVGAPDFATLQSAIRSVR